MKMCCSVIRTNKIENMVELDLTRVMNISEKKKKEKEIFYLFKKKFTYYMKIVLKHVFQSFSLVTTRLTPIMETKF